MNEQNLIAAISSINTWWAGLPVSARIKKSDHKRKVFFDLSRNCLETKNITSISGPRQVGKTTLMGQLIDYQLKDKRLNSKRIIYIPIDNELLRLNSDNVLIDSLKVYFEFVVGENPETLKNKVYVYIDEVQELNNWAKQLKSYQDTYENIKFIISGSSHTQVYKDASESLVGRIEFRLVLPFKFKEFLEFYLGDTMSKNLQFSSVNLRDYLEQSIKEGDVSVFYKALTRLKIQLTPEMPKIKKYLDMYLIKGGYPGVLEFNDDYDKSLERIRTDLELTVFKDIYKIFNTRNTTDLMDLLVLTASSSGQKINYTRLSDTLKIDRRVVSDYLSYTKLLYITSESPFYKSNKYKQIEKMNKIYLVDNGHRNALLGKMNNELLKESEIGLVLQSVAYNHAVRLKFHLTKHSEHDVCYWENDDSEIDLVLDVPILILPIEVKSNAGDKSVGVIYKFMEEHKKTKFGIIITRDELKIEKDILFMPIWAFLLMC